MAPSGSVANTGGLLLAGAVTASAMNGVDLTVSAGALDAKGDLSAVGDEDFFKHAVRLNSTQR